MQKKQSSIWLLTAAMLLFAPALLWATDYSGSYDVGGGNNDFTSPQAAVADLADGTLVGPVTLNVYSGVYSGEVTITAFDGLGVDNPLVIQNATGETPVIENYVLNGTGVRIAGASYVTIRGMEIRNCQYNLRIEMDADSSRNITIENNYLHHSSAWATNGYTVFINRAVDCVLRSNRIEAQGPYACTTLRAVYSQRNKFYNNMIAGSPYRNNEEVVDEGYCGYHEWYYNTFVGLNTSAVFTLTCNEDEDPVTIKNNIFYNWTDPSLYGTCMYLNLSYRATNLTTDYNLFFSMSSDTTVFAWDGFARSIEQWRDSTGGQDMNSKVFSPSLVSVVEPWDLHLANLPSLADSMGTPIVGITTDFDGEVRDALYPDVGADEATLPYSPFYLGYQPVTPDPGSAFQLYEFKIDYLHPVGVPPTTAELYVDDAYAADLIVPGGSFFDGVTLYNGIVLNAGNHTHYYSITAGGVTQRFPPTGSFDGPVAYSTLSGTLDVGGGNMNFPTLVDAMDALHLSGMDGSVILNVYDGTYEGQVNITNQIFGLGTQYSLVIQNAPGQHPVVTYLSGENTINIVSADSVTIRGLEITGPLPIGIIYSVISQSPYMEDYPLYNRIEGNTLVCTTAGTSTCMSMRRGGDTHVVGNHFRGGYFGVKINESRVGNKFYNNMFTEFGQFGISNSGNVQIEWIANSVYHTGTSGCCFYQTGGSGGSTKLKNNIFYASNGAHCIYRTLGLASLPDTCDYNCLYSPEGKIYQTIDFEGFPTEPSFETLAEWQAGFGLDQNSVTGDPGFVSETDLHINTNFDLVDNVGIDVSYVTTDFDGEGRRETPDIGADEYDFDPTPPPVEGLTLYRVVDDLELRWLPSPGAVSYLVYRMDTLGGAATYVGTTTDTFYTVPYNTSIGFYYVIASSQLPE